MNNDDSRGCFFLVAAGVFAVMCVIGYVVQLSLLAGTW